MSHILFLIYSAVFGASFFTKGNDLSIAVGVFTGVAIFWAFFRYACMMRSAAGEPVGYYAMKYLRILICLAALVPYVLLPARVAAIVCYAFMATWLYILPFLRLVILRAFYMEVIKHTCRERHHKINATQGGVIVCTPHTVYDIRLVGAFRRKGVVELTGRASYTLFHVPAYASDRPDFLRKLLRAEEGTDLLLRKACIGRKRVHTLHWTETLSDKDPLERVLLFLPGMCAWKYQDGEQALAEGSVLHGIRLYDADAFIEQKLR